MISEEKYNQLLRLYSGELPLEEKFALETEMKNNLALAEAYENIDLLEKAALQARLFDIENLASTVYQQQVRKTKIRNWMLISSGVLLVGLLSFWYAKSSLAQKETPNIFSQSTNLSPSEVKSANAVDLKEIVVSNNKSSFSPNYSSEGKKEIDSRSVKQSELKFVGTEPLSEQEPNPKVLSEIKTSTEAVVTTKIQLENPTPILGEKVAIDPCIANPIELVLQSSASCKGEENGNIRATIRGGNPPYKEQILDSENRKFASAGLPVGKYWYRVTDFEHCERVQTFEIKAKICAQHFEFNPNLGKTLSFEAQKGKLIIQTQRGESYFEKELSEVDSFEWNGKSDDGESRSGLFLFRIELNGNQTQFGTITIVE